MKISGKNTSKKRDRAVEYILSQMMNVDIASERFERTKRREQQPVVLVVSVGVSAHVSAQPY